jgi:hypothetical protein
VGAAAYRTPSPWASILSGAGSMLGSYAGRSASPNGPQLPFAPTPSDMLSGVSSSGSSDLGF